MYSVISKLKENLQDMFKENIYIMYIFFRCFLIAPKKKRWQNLHIEVDQNSKKKKKNENTIFLICISVISKSVQAIPNITI